MNCTTVKAGSHCAFMTKTGCGYTGGACLPIIAQCDGCQRVVELEKGKYCASYPNPASKWNAGNCNFATHIKIEATVSAKVNPLKASKKSAKKKK
jgi:hypothetical protein